MTEPLPSPEGAPQLRLERLLLVVTGSASASMAPFWLDWLRQVYPRLEVSVVLTHSAQRFVTRQAVAHRVDGEVVLDTWPQEETHARHVRLEQWAQGVVVYPATLHYCARLALGLADSPSLLALQCSKAPIAVAPALPPGGFDSPAFQGHWATLAARPNVAMVAPEAGRSITTGRQDAWVPPPLPEVMGYLAQRHAQLTGEPEYLDAFEPSGLVGRGPDDRPSTPVGDGDDQAAPGEPAGHDAADGRSPAASEPAGGAGASAAEVPR